MVCPPFKCISIPYFLQVLLKLSLSPWWYGTVMCDYVLGCYSWFYCSFSSWGLLSDFSVSLYLGPRLDTCISLVFCIGALLHPAGVLVQNIWFLPCGTESQSCCIWMVWHDGCPNAGIGWCVLASCRQWS